MASLVSPGVSVSLIDESFYVAGAAATVPLIVIATADHKLQPDGTSPAVGTYEYGVVRTITSISQSSTLYGVPKYYTDAAGNPLHGDCRNEYGLDGINKFLQVANRVYSIRANVNLNDNYSDIKTLWTSEISDSADLLSSLVSSYIVEYNNANDLVPADVNYRTTVTKSEMLTLTSEALVDVLAMYSFSSADFQKDFIQDHTVAHAGYQDVMYKSTAGYIQASDVTGLNNDTTVYGFELAIVSTGGSANVQVPVTGSAAQTFGDLISLLQTEIQSLTSSSSTVQLISGRIRITSDLLGSTSAVSISDGYSGVSALFANTNLFKDIETAIPGSGIHSLDVYNDDFTSIIGSYDGLDGLINNWTSGSVVTTQFTADEAEGLLLAAAADFDNTLQFKSETSLGANDAARRTEIIKQLKAVINSNTAIRGENYAFTLVACPGFPEVTAEMLLLSQEKFSEVFVIGETAFDKPPTGPNSIVEWAATTAKVFSNNTAYYYPHGLSSNLDGATILTTAASIALRTYAYNDLVAAVWYAPFGSTRGIVPEVDSIGYVSGTLGTATTFVVDLIDNGTRDALYEFGVQINPISFIPGRGILVMGQKTTYGATSALDRVNVSRLICYIRRQIRQALFPYLGEPDDSITWENAHSTVSSFLGTLVGRRALYDFACIIDSTNNTSDTIDNNEMHVEIAIKPVKTVEFIYVDLKVVNTGADIGGR